MLQKIANFLRLFWGCVFLAGVVINLAIGFINPHLYDFGGQYAWPSFLQDFWTDAVVPNMLLFIILYAAIELVLGLLIVNKGKPVKIGLAGALFFGAGLLMIGLGARQDDWLARIPNLTFEAIIIFCLFFNYDKSLWEMFKRKKADVRTSVIGG